MTDSGSTDTKICPFCAEEIKAAAIKCKHCKSDLVDAEIDCPYCAERVLVTADTCPHCGESLRKEEKAGKSITTATSEGNGEPTSAPVRTKKKLRIGMLFIWIAVFVVVGYIAGGFISQVVFRVALDQAPENVRIATEVCLDDPDCHVPFFNFAGWITLFVVVSVGLLITKSTWRSKLTSTKRD